jgi:hypothetical protein
LHGTIDYSVDWLFTSAKLPLFLTKLPRPGAQNAPRSLRASGFSRDSMARGFLVAEGQLCYLSTKFPTNAGFCEKNQA